LKALQELCEENRAKHALKEQQRELSDQLSRSQKKSSPELQQTSRYRVVPRYKTTMSNIAKELTVRCANTTDGVTR
jgi:DNA topoisomerase VI subunit B